MPRSGKSPKDTSKRTPRKKATKTSPSGAKAHKSATKAPAHKAQAAPAKPATGANSKPEAQARHRKHAAKTPFGKKDLHYFKNKLLERRRLILENVLTMEAEALKTSGQDFSVDHMADHGSDNFEQDFTLSLVENERKELVRKSRVIRSARIRSPCLSCSSARDGHTKGAKPIFLSAPARMPQPPRRNERRSLRLSRNHSSPK